MNDEPRAVSIEPDIKCTSHLNLTRTMADVIADEWREKNRSARSAARRAGKPAPHQAKPVKAEKPRRIRRIRYAGYDAAGGRA